ncbi:MAG: hypothetical protein Q9176_007908 [Flavoplaca citrina]
MSHPYISYALSSVSLEGESRVETSDDEDLAICIDHHTCLPTLPPNTRSLREESNEDQTFSNPPSVRPAQTLQAIQLFPPQQPCVVGSAENHVIERQEPEESSSSLNTPQLFHQQQPSVAASLVDHAGGSLQPKHLPHDPTSPQLLHQQQPSVAASLVDHAGGSLQPKHLSHDPTPPQLLNQHQPSGIEGLEDNDVRSLGPELPSTISSSKRSLSRVDDDKSPSVASSIGSRRKRKRSRRSPTHSVFSISSDSESQDEREGVKVDAFAGEDDNPPAQNDPEVADYIDDETAMRAIMDTEACEQQPLWKTAASNARIYDWTHSNRDKQYQIPGILGLIFHWQWLAIFFVLKNNCGIDDIWGAMVGDEPGLGKTWLGFCVAVVRLLLWRRWREIEEEWRTAPATRRHCPEHAPHDAVCPSNNSFFVNCPCQPSSDLHQCRPQDGCTIIFVPPPNIQEWVDHIEEHVDLKRLGIEFVVAYKDVTHRPLHPHIRKLKTIRDPNDPNAQFPRSKKAQHPAAFGLPTLESTSIWVLTTYQTWNIECKKFDFKRKYTYQEKGEKKTEPDTIHEFQCGMAIIDESHKVSTIGAGHWRPLERMRRDRPHLRFWCLAMSGTILHTSPRDIAAPISIMSSRSWDKPEHPLHDLRVERLLEADSLLSNQDPDSPWDGKLQTFIDRFKTLLYRVLIRRNENSTWFGQPLIDLPPLEKRAVHVKFPEKHRAAHDSLVQKWADQMRTKLAKEQEDWDQKKYDPAYLQKHPKRPERLNSQGVFNSSNTRLLRVTSILPSLACRLPNYPDQHWTNTEVELSCIDRTTGTMTTGCVLDKEWDDSKDDPRLKKLVKIIGDHPDKPFLVFSSFTEVIVSCERIIREQAGSRTMGMYFGTQKTKTVAKNKFKGVTNAEGKLISGEQPDGLGGTIKTLGTGHNLTRAKLIILMEPIYESYLWTQIPKRAHRYGQKEKVFFYTLSSDTKIEEYVTDRRLRKEGFGERAFARLAETLEKMKELASEKEAEKAADEKAAAEKDLEMEV